MLLLGVDEGSAYISSSPLPCNELSCVFDSIKRSFSQADLRTFHQIHVWQGYLREELQNSLRIQTGPMTPCCLSLLLAWLHIDCMCLLNFFAIFLYKLSAKLLCAQTDFSRCMVCDRSA